MRRFLLLSVLLIWPHAAFAQDGTPIVGTAVVTGADRIELNGEKFYLWGVDAPEMIQPCYIDGTLWECGPAAARKLEELVALGPVTCQQMRDTDRTRRIFKFVVCQSASGEDVGEEMVRSGMALAFRPQTEAYVTAEEAAAAEGVGVWRGKFQLPWEYRDLMRNGGL